MGRLRCVLVLAAALLASACATGPGTAPQAPDDSALRPAQQMLARAQQAGAAQFAPEPLRAASRRLSIAHALLDRAGARRRSLTKAEKKRVADLGDEAYVDARLALTRTQQGAVQNQSRKLRAEAADGDQQESQ